MTDAYKELNVISVFILMHRRPDIKLRGQKRENIFPIPSSTRLKLQRMPLRYLGFDQTCFKSDAKHARSQARRDAFYFTQAAALTWSIGIRFLSSV